MRCFVIVCASGGNAPWSAHQSSGYTVVPQPSGGKFFNKFIRPSADIEPTEAIWQVWRKMVPGLMGSLKVFRDGRVIWLHGLVPSDDLRRQIGHLAQEAVGSHYEIRNSLGVDVDWTPSPSPKTRGVSARAKDSVLLASVRWAILRSFGTAKARFVYAKVRRSELTIWVPQDVMKPEKMYACMSDLRQRLIHLHLRGVTQVSYLSKG